MIFCYENIEDWYQFRVGKWITDPVYTYENPVCCPIYSFSVFFLKKKSPTVSIKNLHFNPIFPRYWRKRSEELVLTTLLEIFWNLLVSTNNKSHLMMIKCYKLKMLEKKKIRTMPLLHLTDISQQILLTVYVYRIIFSFDDYQSIQTIC